MERYAVPRAVVAEVAEVTNSKKVQRTNEEVQQIMEWARHDGLAGALRRYQEEDGVKKKLTWSTVNNWLKYWKQNKVYYTHQKRGQKCVLTQSEESEAKAMCTAPLAQGSTFAAIARGVVLRTCPAVLAKHDGFYQMGTSWAKYVETLRKCPECSEHVCDGC